MAGRVRIERKPGDISDTVGRLEKKHFHSFWILSFFCFFLSVSHKKSEASRFEMYDTWDFSAEDFSNTVAIFQESPCTCSLSLLGPPRHVYSFERSIYS